MRSPHGVRLAPGVPHTSGSATVIVGQSLSDHPDDVSVYLAFLPPGGSTNPGGCSALVPGATASENVEQVFNWTRIATTFDFVNLVPGEKVTLKVDVDWVCTNPSVVDDGNWTLKAIADAHADDADSCDTLEEIFDATCNTAINGDDDNDGNTTKTRPFPLVTALSP